MKQKILLSLLILILLTLGFSTLANAYQSGPMPYVSITHCEKIWKGYTCTGILNPGSTGPYMAHWYVNGSRVGGGTSYYGPWEQSFFCSYNNYNTLKFWVVDANGVQSNVARWSCNPVLP